jgi:uncharacterized membrane protein
MADDGANPSPDTVGTTRLEAFSDGVFAIAITLLVLDLALGSGDSPLDRVLDAWPFYFAYLISFFTIGAAWLGHTGITDRLERADFLFLRLNLILLLFVTFLPFPTRLLSEALNNVEDERVFVTMYGLTLLTMRLLLHALDAYARRAHLYAPIAPDEELAGERRTARPVVIAYGFAIVVGLALPRLAVVLYFLLAIFLIVPIRETARLLFGRS